MKHGLINQRTLFICTLASTLALASAGIAMATEVHTWTDENGVIHYSDAPRSAGESETIEIEEIYRPGTSEAYPTPDQANGDEAPAEPGEIPQSAAQQRREQIARDRQQRRENQEVTDALCARHKDRLERVEPARRVMYANDEGEMVRMDDDERMKLVAESKEFIADNCD